MVKKLKKKQFKRLKVQTNCESICICKKCIQDTCNRFDCNICDVSPKDYCSCFIESRGGLFE